ncbi:MAG TPA: right-handed parallel beta-helix repeat-containing protein [Armatimonadota bacterium]|jgi:parallel beta-helix repeat protein
MERITRPALCITLSLLFVLCCGFVRPALSGVVYVDLNAPGTVQDGKSWSTAFTAVQTSIDSANSGDEIWVVKGRYLENLTLKSGVSLYGGFNGTETARAQRNVSGNTTILDGAGTASEVNSFVEGPILDGFAIRTGDVAMQAGSGVTVYLGTLTIANCTFNNNSRGLFVYGAGTAIVANCNFSGNRDGAGIDRSGTASFSSCSFTGNGNGVYGTDSGKATLTGCTLTGNDVGVSLYTNSTASISNCAFSGNGDSLIAMSGSTMTVSNSAFSHGHDGRNGVTLRESTATITGCSITGAIYGILQYPSSTATVTNSILAFNRIGIWRYDGATLELSHSDIFGNTVDLWNVADPIGTNGNINRDPLFKGLTNGDLHLLRGSPCIDAGDDLGVAPGSFDLDGNPRISGRHVDIGAFERQPPAPWSSNLGAVVKGGVTVTEGIAYVGGGDGKLSARSTEDGSAVSGFPVDISAAVGATVMLPSRPAVYYGKTGKAVYLTTDRGDVVRVLPNGTVAWQVRPLPGQTVSTPAVTPDGKVFVNLSTGSGPFNNYVFKLDEATGTPLSLSPFLGYTNAGDLGDFSPAASGRYLYVNAGWASGSGLTLLNQDNLTVRSSFAGGERCLSPMLVGNDLILASKGGKVWKMNAVTLNPDLGFGHFGVADIGSPITAAPFADAGGNVYLGTANGRILKWAPGSASFQPFYAANGRIAGLTINRTAGVLAFGTSSGSFVQVPLSQPSSATTTTLGGPVSTGTVYDSLADRFIVVTDSGVLSGYPSAR